MGIEYVIESAERGSAFDVATLEQTLLRLPHSQPGRSGAFGADHGGGWSEDVTVRVEGRQVFLTDHCGDRAVAREVLGALVASLTSHRSVTIEQLSAEA